MADLARAGLARRTSAPTDVVRVLLGADGLARAPRMRARTRAGSPDAWRGDLAGQPPWPPPTGKRERGSVRGVPAAPPHAPQTGGMPLGCAHTEQAVSVPFSQGAMLGGLGRRGDDDLPSEPSERLVAARPSTADAIPQLALLVCCLEWRQDVAEPSWGIRGGARPSLGSASSNAARRRGLVVSCVAPGRARGMPRGPRMRDHPRSPRRRGRSRPGCRARRCWRGGRSRQRRLRATGGVPLQGRACPRQVAAVAQDHQVVGDAGLRIGPDPISPRA